MKDSLLKQNKSIFCHQKILIAFFSSHILLILWGYSFILFFFHSSSLLLFSFHFFFYSSSSIFFPSELNNVYLLIDSRTFIRLKTRNKNAFCWLEGNHLLSLFHLSQFPVFRSLLISKQYKIIGNWGLR